MSLALLYQQWQERFDTVNDTVQIDVYQVLPILDISIVHHRTNPDTRVIAQ